MGEVKAIAITNGAIDTVQLMDVVRDLRFGGIVVFTGEVRAITGELDTSKLIYETHESMALAQMRKIAELASEKWDANVAISHRVGELLPGDTAVVCVAACAHRAQAFECCRYIIDQVKEDVPIWKKEFGSTGEAWIAGDQRHDG